MPAVWEGGGFNPELIYPRAQPQPQYDPPAPQYYPYYPQNPYYGGSRHPTPAPPPDPWAGIAGATHDAAVQIEDTFQKLVGLNHHLDSAGDALKLAKAMPWLTNTNLGAYEWLFENTLQPGAQALNPWARFGMDQDTYFQTTSKLNAVYADWTGQQLGNAAQNSADIANKDAALWQAIRGSWTPDQIRNYAMYGNAEGTGPLLADAQYGGAMPWLSQGQTFSATQAAYQQFEGQLPTDKNTLADFWRFGSSLKTIGQAQAAPITVAPGALTSQKSSTVR